MSALLRSFSRSLRATSSVLAAVMCAALGSAQIAPNDGIVGGVDGTNYRLWLVPQLGGATPGAAVELAISTNLKARMIGFVIDQANGDVIAVVKPNPFSGGPLRIWRIKVQGTLVLSETQLTSLPDTTDHGLAAIHRDGSGGILVLSRLAASSTEFTTNRVAVTRGGARASTIPISNPQNYIISSIATNPSGEIVLGGRTDFTSSASGVTGRVGQNGGTPIFDPLISGFRVSAIETSTTGLLALGLISGSIPAPANYSCGGATSLFQYNTTNNVTTLFNDIQLTPAGTKYVLVGSSFFGLGGYIRVNANGCIPGIPTDVTTFPHGLNHVAIAFATPNYGCGCPPASTNVLPKIEQLAPPSIGQVWQMRVSNAVPGSTAMLIAGRGDQTYAGLPLPQALSVAPFFGQAHCFLLNGAQFQFGVLNTNINGQAVNGRAVPNDPTLLGTKLYSQFLVFEATGGPAYSTAGYISTVQ